MDIQRPVSMAPSTSVVTAPAAVVRRSVVGRVASVDTARSHVIVATGAEQLLLQLPPSVVRDLRPGDQITLDVQPVR